MYKTKILSEGQCVMPRDFSVGEKVVCIDRAYLKLQGLEYYPGITEVIEIRENFDKIQLVKTTNYDTFMYKFRYRRVKI